MRRFAPVVLAGDSDGHAALVSALDAVAGRDRFLDPLVVVPSSFLPRMRTGTAASGSTWVVVPDGCHEVAAAMAGAVVAMAIRNMAAPVVILLPDVNRHAFWDFGREVARSRKAADAGGAVAFSNSCGRIVDLVIDPAVLVKAVSLSAPAVSEWVRAAYDRRKEGADTVSMDRVSIGFVPGMEVHEAIEDGGVALAMESHEMGPLPFYSPWRASHAPEPSFYGAALVRS